jgi:hypothetical protein
MASRPFDLWSSSNISTHLPHLFCMGCFAIGTMVFTLRTDCVWLNTVSALIHKGRNLQTQYNYISFLRFFYGTPSDSVWISWKRSRGFPSEIVWVLFGISYRCLWHFADFLWVLHAIPWILNGLSSGFVCVIYCVDFLRIWYGLLWDFCIGILEFVCWFLADVV